LGVEIVSRMLGKDDVGYPARLRDMPRPPDPLFLSGPWDFSGPHVAIVGTRDPTDDGIDVTRALARELVARGAVVVSGLARGIDAAAHEAALESGGRSGAVLGTSLEETYPPEHRSLQIRLSRSLGLMSEIPPGRSATRSTFATRNRILAAISDVVVVVQGREGSGALITAEGARRLRRRVAALPWDSRDPLGEAPHALIRRGVATLVRHADDVLALLARADAVEALPVARSVSRVAPIDIDKLTPAEAALYRALRDHPRRLDDLAQISALGAPELSVALLALELHGLASRMPGGLVRRTRRPSGFTKPQSDPAWTPERTRRPR
jgi:DNA processing protein